MWINGWRQANRWPQVRLLGLNSSTAPVTSAEASQVEAVLQSRIVSLGKPESTLAADLFNKTGRRRGSRFDCLIAVTAILNHTRVATANQSDFKAFTTHGLTLA